MRKLKVILVTLFVTTGLSVVAVPPATASPLCSVGQICGKVHVAKSSKAKCTLFIDGNWGNGSKGYHPKLADRRGFARYSTTYFKDTDGFRVSKNCTGKSVNSGKKYKGGKWYKLSDYQNIKMKMY